MNTFWSLPFYCLLVINRIILERTCRCLICSVIASSSRLHPVSETKRGRCTWRSHDMMTSSNGNIFRVTGPSCGEFTGTGEFPTQRPVSRSFDVFFDLRLNKRLSKQPWGWWFETQSCSLWRHRNDMENVYPMIHRGKHWYIPFTI